MTLPNRVTPRGEIVAQPARGTMMGNRGGRLHDERRRLGTRRWASKAWICCVLSFRGRSREVMGRGYTELFFLDEAVALAAGHRPCFECRHAAARAFRDAWAEAHGPAGATEIDAALHAARVRRGRSQVTVRIAMAEVPDGAFVEGRGGPALVLGDRLHPWRPEGYGDPLPRPDGKVEVLTPAPTLGALRAGYGPALHPSARERLGSGNGGAGDGNRTGRTETSGGIDRPSVPTRRSGS